MPPDLMGPHRRPEFEVINSLAHLIGLYEQRRITLVHFEVSGILETWKLAAAAGKEDKCSAIWLMSHVPVLCS